MAKRKKMMEKKKAKVKTANINDGDENVGESTSRHLSSKWLLFAAFSHSIYNFMQTFVIFL